MVAMEIAVLTRETGETIQVTQAINPFWVIGIAKDSIAVNLNDEEIVCSVISTIGGQQLIVPLPGEAVVRMWQKAINKKDDH